MRVELIRAAPTPPIVEVTITLSAKEAHDLRTIASLPENVLREALRKANDVRIAEGRNRTCTYDVHGLARLLAEELEPVPGYRGPL